MPKINFTQSQQLDLTKRLQLLLLDAVMATGSWQKDQFRFQGGTCLSLAYGSPRFSEDLDFLIGTEKGMQRMITGASARVVDSLRSILPGAQVKFSARDEDAEASDAKNPRTFMMSVSHPDWYRVIKIKLEFWLAHPEAVAQYRCGVRSANVLAEIADGSPLRAQIAPVLVNTAHLEEIVVDKLHALVARPYMKHRDVFDLWWLKQQGKSDWAQYMDERYEYHAQMYSDSPALEDMPAKLQEKADAIASMVGQPEFSTELKKWLGESASLASQASANFIAHDVCESLGACVLDLRQRVVMQTPSADSSPRAHRSPRP